MLLSMRPCVRNVAEGMLFLSCLSVHLSMRPCVRPETLLTQYLPEYLTHFHQTYANNALYDRDERILGSEVKVVMETALSGLINMMS